MEDDGGKTHLSELEPETFGSVGHWALQRPYKQFKHWTQPGLRESLRQPLIWVWGRGQSNYNVGPANVPALLAA
jgi:hypothetical protein